MANEIEKVNTLTLANIEKINTRTDANIQELNTLEMTGFTYNGITWTTDDVIPVGSNHGQMCGKVDAALYVNGSVSSPLSYEHNGSSWASSVATGGAKHETGQAGGTQGAAVVYGGHDGSTEGVTTDEYNGASGTWETVNSMTAGSAFAMGGGEVQTAQFVTGGSPGNTTTTQTYNGTTWTDESVPSSGIGSGTGQNSGGGGLDACLQASGSGGTTDSNLFSKTAGSWTSKAAVSVGVTYPGSSSDGTRIYKIGGHHGSGYNASTIKDYVESWVENTWTSESVIPVRVFICGWGGGGRQSPGGAFQAGGATWNGSSVDDNDDHYFTAAATP